MKFHRLLAVLLILSLSWLPGPEARLMGSPPGAQGLNTWQNDGPPGWQAKVDADALQAAAGGESEFLVVLTEQADLSHTVVLKDKAVRGQAVTEALQAVAQRSQAPVIAQLENAGLEYTPYWIVNMIRVRGGPEVLEELARLEQVQRVYANPSVPLQSAAPELQIEQARAALAVPRGVEWNIARVNANDVWAAGYTGQGIVVGGQDTGYQWDHPALKGRYRGWTGSNADHSYNWHDAIHTRDSHYQTDNTLCPFNSPAPCDDSGHGTHTMGIILGSDGSNQIGMAPGAQWIGCRNMDRGYGTPATYAECYQWFVAPTDQNGENPRPDLAPDVINNSWSCPPGEGCIEPDILRQVVENVRAAGILTVHSAGNAGPKCSTIHDPASIYEASFTVGATDSSDTITSYSSRGPVTSDGSGRVKPDVSAPGGPIRSSVLNNGYGSLSGTSMAAPHVAGQVALLLSAQPALRGQVDSLEALVAQTATRLESSECESTPGRFPNNVYGWGRIDALAALHGHALSISKSVHPLAIRPGDVLTYTLHVTHTALFTPTTNLVIRDRLPAGTALVTASDGYILAGDEVRWELPSLAANASLSVQLVVSTPLTATGELINGEYGVSSADRSLISGPPVRMVFTAQRGVSLEAADRRLVSRESTFLAALTNTGAEPDVFDLEVSSSLGWAGLAGESRISLLAGQTAFVLLRVTIPPEVPLGTEDSLTITAVSYTDPTASDSQVVTLRAAAAYHLPLVPAQSP